MPWLETNPMDQRLRLLDDLRLDRVSMTELLVREVDLR
jgi:hypothetical protein